MAALEVILPVLMNLQANLGGDLSLHALAAIAGLSPFHFHRVFRESVGETVKDYTLRLRLERAAFRLLLHDEKVLDIALDCGFQSHETFTRAFRRRFGMTPSDYRSRHARCRAEASVRSREILDDPARGFVLSEPKVVRMRETHVAFIRHTGPYETVSEKLWDDLTAWAERHEIPGPMAFFGIGHDAPSTTPAELLRFDAAIRVPVRFAPKGRIAHQVLAGGTFAVTSHVGHYATLPNAYVALFTRLFSIKGYRVIGLPAIEVYHTTRVNPANHLNHTDIYIPVAAST